MQFYGNGGLRDGGAFLKGAASWCTGCEACASICHQDAIKMREGGDGFLYPTIDESKCLSCGLCEKACYKCFEMDAARQVRACYAAWADDATRSESSSGGMFSAIAGVILGEKGFVCGACLDGTRVRHRTIERREDLELLRSSKYVQSRIGNVYREIKDLIAGEKKILFSGTPCQVAGLYAYLGCEPAGLYTVDILCHGVPSQACFDKYLSEICEGERVRRINFRDKSRGWTYDLLLKIETEENAYYMHSDKDPFYRAFLERLSLRKSCGECRFASASRMGDVSLGDFWEIWQYKRELDDRKGTSLVLVNSKKGEELLKGALPALKMIEEVPLEAARRGNTSLVCSTPLHKDRDYFISQAKDKPLGSVLGMVMGRDDNE